MDRGRELDGLTLAIRVQCRMSVSLILKSTALLSCVMMEYNVSYLLSGKHCISKLLDRDCCSTLLIRTRRSQMVLLSAAFLTCNCLTISVDARCCFANSSNLALKKAIASAITLN